ncbi:MAG: zf-HC2 domain-containing protein [Acidimicrobiia bacterium]
MRLDASHRRMRRNIAAYVDGELSDRALVTRVEEHLRECWMCSCDAETWRLIRCSLRRLAQRRPVDLGAARLRRRARRVVT